MAADLISRLPTTPQPMPTLGGTLLLDRDPVNWETIPKPARDRLRVLRRERDDAAALRRALADELQAEREKVRAAEQRLRFLLGGTRGSKWFSELAAKNFPAIDENHPDVLSNEKRLATARAEIERLAPLIRTREDEWREVARLVEGCEYYLRETLGGRRTDIALHEDEDEPRPLGAKETALDRVEALRQRQRELVADRHRILSAPWPSVQAKQRLRTEIEALAESGAPNILNLIESDSGGVVWSQNVATEHVIGGHLITTRGSPPALPLLLWLHRDLIVAKLEQEIDRIADDEHALSQQQRDEQLAVIEADLLAVERAEEHWLQQARNGGAVCPRRPQADARAVLHLAGTMPPPAR